MSSVECFLGSVAFRASSISDRRALFTASSFGNASATSGLSTIIFDDSRIRPAYFPRTKPAGKSDRLYSLRNSSLSGKIDFILGYFFRRSFDWRIKEGAGLTLNFNAGDPQISANHLVQFDFLHSSRSDNVTTPSWTRTLARRRLARPEALNSPWVMWQISWIRSEQAA